MTHTEAMAETPQVNGHVSDGMHLIADLECAWGLSDKKAISEFIRQVVELTGLHLMHLYVHTFPNGHLRWWERLLLRKRPKTSFGPGITAVAVLAESHLSLHTIPEKDWMYFDLFSCRSLDMAGVRSLLNIWFGVRYFHRWLELKR